MADPVCTCDVVAIPGTVGCYTVRKCDLCKAAPELYRALDELQADCRGIRRVCDAMDALAHARGEHD